MSGVPGGLDLSRLTAFLHPSARPEHPDEQRDVPPSEVHVVDGDTLRLGDQVVRLDGVQAPPRGETCVDAAGRSFDCGAAAAEKLASLVAHHAVDCQLHGSDAFSRSLGICRSAETEVNAQLVAEGWALASGETLLAKEDQARSRRLGLWASGVVPPAEWQERR
ncbi:thermonuclease family protein [Roseomonas elaeocarpi]|uniref:Thermonuclease family protein n=1 Tax=Roseomonas elaeocarpi TaxID=907779 RepID=A0ABV6JQ07_9PROT